MTDDDNGAKLWDVKTGLELRTFDCRGRSWNVRIGFSRDGKALITDCSNELTIWDVATGKKKHSLSTEGELQFEPNGDFFWLNNTGENGTIVGVSVFKEIGGRAFGTFKLPDGGVDSVALSKGGETLAISTSGGDAAPTAPRTVTLWKLATGKQLHALKYYEEGSSYWTHLTVFSPGGDKLLTRDDRAARTWDVSIGRELATVRVNAAEKYSLRDVVFGSGGRTLVGAAYSYERRETIVRMWDAATGAELKSLTLPDYEGIKFSPGGRFLVGRRQKVATEIIDASTGETVSSLRGYTEVVRSVGFSPDGKSLVSVGKSNIKFWSLAADAAPRTLTTVPSGMTDAVLSPDGNIFAAQSGKTIELLDASSGARLRSLVGHATNVNAVAFSHDGQTLASGSAFGYASSKSKTATPVEVKLWEVATGKELHTLGGHTAGVSSLAFSPDGRILASGGDDGTIKLWDVSSGKELRTMSGKDYSVRKVQRDRTGNVIGKNPVYAVAFSPDGKLLASGEEDNKVRLWDVATGAEAKLLTENFSRVTAVAFSPDGKTLAAGGENMFGNDHIVMLWGITSGALLRAHTRHANVILSVAFSPDGKTLASSASDGSVKLWSVPQGDEPVSLIHFVGNDWLVVNSDGFFDGSPAAWGLIFWRFAGRTSDVAPVESFFNEFYHPGLLGDTTSGRRPRAARALTGKDRRQPDIEVSAAGAPGSSGGKTTERRVTIKVTVTESRAASARRGEKRGAGSGARDVRLFRNGSLVKVWHGDVLAGRSSVSLEAVATLVAGENRFTAYAFNRDDVKSADATLTINGAESLKRAGTAYVLAVGVNSYANGEYDLKYAVADARDFGDEFKRQQERLGHYRKTEVIPLYDGDATKANLLRALTDLSGLVQPEDAVVLYFAGHGTALKNRFYLIPHDLGYMGPRSKISAAGLRSIVEHSISDRELERAFEGVDAGKLLMVIDACNSGQALEAEEKRRGPMNSKGLAQLAYEKGMYILTASQSLQFANEEPVLGHGYLTYVLVNEGLRSAAADKEPEDDTVYLREWFRYAEERVPALHKEQMGKRSEAELAQLRSRKVRDLKLGGVEDVQRPRVFYRRELETQPLVVARPGSAAPVK